MLTMRKRFFSSIRYSFVSDVEGNYDYWLRFVQSCEALSYCPEKKMINLAEGHGLVYCGDVCDRGNGDIRILQDLISLKDRYMNDVIFIIGNRDCNKLRLYPELSDIALQHPESIYWTSAPLDPNRANKNDMSSRLKWLLKNTMGSPDTFEYRRSELSILQNRSIDSVDDEEVCHSFIDLVNPVKFLHRFQHAPEFQRFFMKAPTLHPWLSTLFSSSPSPSPSHSCSTAHSWDGLLLKYLFHAHLAVLLGDSLVVHGAVRSSNYGFVPPNVVGLPWESRCHSHQHQHVQHVQQPLQDCSDESNCLKHNQLHHLLESHTARHWNQHVNCYHHLSYSLSPDLTKPLVAWIQELERFKNRELLDYVFNMDAYLEFSRRQMKSCPIFTSTSTTSTTSSNPSSTPGDHGISEKGILWADYGGYSHYQPASRLLQYGMGSVPISGDISSSITTTATTTTTTTTNTPPGSSIPNPSIIYGHYFHQGQPQLTRYCNSSDNSSSSITATTATTAIATTSQSMTVDTSLLFGDECWKNLKNAGVDRVIVGHQPHGDCPIVVQTNHPADIQIIGVDTSYSRDVLWVPSELSVKDLLPNLGKKGEESISTSLTSQIIDDNVNSCNTSAPSEKNGADELPWLQNWNQNVKNTRGLAVGHVMLEFSLSDHNSSTSVPTNVTTNVATSVATSVPTATTHAWHEQNEDKNQTWTEQVNQSMLGKCRGGQFYGLLSNGMPYFYEFGTKDKDNEMLLGRQNVEGRVIKMAGIGNIKKTWNYQALLGNLSGNKFSPSQYLMSYGKGYSLYNCIISSDRLKDSRKNHESSSKESS